MGTIFRSVSKSAFFGLALASIVSLAPRPALAQFGGIVEDPADTTTITGILTGLGLQLQGLVGLPPQVPQPGTLTQIDNDIQALSGTLTNTATMSSAISGKAVDSQANTAYVMEQQKAQAVEQVNAASGSLNYQRNNLCQQATLQGGRSTMDNAMATELAAYNPYLSANPNSAPTLSGAYGGIYQGMAAGCTTCGGSANGVPSPAGTIGRAFTTTAVSSKIAEVAKAATAFFGAAEGGSDTATWNNNPLNQTGVTMEDNDTRTAHLDVDPMSLSWLTQTYSDTEHAAHDQLSNYLVGIPDDVISAAKTFQGNPQYAGAVVASREKVAFKTLTAQALAIEAAYHDGANTGAGAAIGQIFTAANKKNPTWTNPLTNQTLVSPMAMDQALYEEPADDPNFATNMASQEPKPLLEFIATEMLLLNRIEYKRYLQEMEMYKIQSASLNLQARTFPFEQHP